MKRSMMQIYVKGSVEAVEFYQKAFSARLGFNGKNDKGEYIHAELDVYGQTLAISEGVRKSGEQMQFCLHFYSDERNNVKKAYDVLKEGALKIDQPPGACMFSPYMTSLIDKFGIYWCLWID
ncbi:MAG: VOC family protein [Spirochaetaceae bacterium]|jgi:PhnB protein|nr:VOC family protein [Spirochaetaceae bacterium]